MKIYFTRFGTFGKKQFKLICNDECLTLFNVFGFGLWIEKTPKHDPSPTPYDEY